MKTYSSKSNATRAFKTLHPELVGVLTNAAIQDAYIRSQEGQPTHCGRCEREWLPVTGCGHCAEPEPAGPVVWAIVIPADVHVVKRHIYKGVQFRRRSEEPEGITSLVHDMFDEYQADAEEAGKELTRKQYIAKAVKDGVAYYTARTQYQKWLRG